MENNLKKFVPGDIVKYAEKWRREEEKDMLLIVKECYNSDEIAYIQPTKSNLFITPTELVRYEMIELYKESPFRYSPLYLTEMAFGKQIIYKLIPGGDSSERLYLISVNRKVAEWSTDMGNAMVFGPKPCREMINKLMDGKVK